MLHPVLRLLATRPHWLAEHAEAYAELAAAEAGAAALAARRSVILSVTAISGLGLAAMLGGVALMLWAALPSLPGATAWVLWAVPALPFAAALVALLIKQSGRDEGSFVLLRQQLQADMALLREAHAS